LVSILKKLESGPYTANQRHAEVRERSVEDVVEAVREKILESHPDLVINARMSRQKRSELVSLISELIVSGELYIPKLTRRDLAERIVQELCGLGPIDELLEDDRVTEVMVNGPGEVYVERDGTLAKTAVTFKDENHVLDIINRVVQGVGRRVDKSMPYVDARLPDGSRVNAIIPPLSLNGPVLTIRRFPKRYTRFEELVSLGTLEASLARFLETAVGLKLDMVVSGGSSSGKTTTLNVLANSMSREERIIVIEDSAEIRIPDHHVVYLESRTENAEGRGQVTIRDLLRNALRMRPDRLIIGECRGKETFDLIIAMNTGHEGCLSTVHANSSRDCLDRLLGMALMAEEGVPVDVLRGWVGIAVDIVVHQVKRQDGSRVISEVSLIGREMGNLAVWPVYFSDGGFTREELPEWFSEKVGKERALVLSEVISDGGAGLRHEDLSNREALLAASMVEKPGLDKPSGVRTS